MGEGTKPLGIFGWVIVLVVVYTMATFIWIMDWIKGVDKEWE